MSSNQHYDVIVIGGGASGMMAAGRAAERGRRVLLLEKNKELGKKLSITGGGRCNILNAEPDTRTLLTHYGEAAKFLHAPFSQHGMADSRAFFETKGLPIVVEARRQAFPATQSAPDVTRVMREYCVKHRVELKTKTRVDALLCEGERVIGAETPSGRYTAESIILATGGSSHADTGSTGEGINWLRELGYTVYDANPNLVPLKAEESWVHESSGTSLSFMKITFGVKASGEKLPHAFSRTGKILFTHFGVSGPLILNAAHEVKKLLARGPVPAAIDLYPDTDVGTLRRRILEIFNRNKNKALRTILKECAPAGMAEAVAAQLSNELLMLRVHSVTQADRLALVDRLKVMPLTITGTMGLDWAVISDGGIDLTEVDTRTMASRRHPNLFFTGDVLHINRPSGGYSLQLCWTTGWVAGSHA